MRRSRRPRRRGRTLPAWIALLAISGAACASAQHRVIATPSLAPEDRAASVVDLLGQKCKGSGGSPLVLELLLSIPECRAAPIHLEIRPIDAASLPATVLRGAQSAPDSGGPQAALRDPDLYVIVAEPVQGARGASARYVARIGSPELVGEGVAADGQLTGGRQRSPSGAAAARFSYYSGARVVVARTSADGDVSAVLCDVLLPAPAGDLHRLRLSGDCPR